MAVICINGFRECDGCGACFETDDEAPEQEIEIDVLDTYKLWRDRQDD